MTSARRFSTLVAMTFSAFANPSAAANLIPDPEFDADVTNWVLHGYGAFRTLTLDYTAGSPTPPSALVSDPSVGHPGFTVSGGWITSPCMPITQTNYDFAFRVKMAPGTYTPPITQVGFYDNDTCTWPAVATDNLATVTPVGDGWLQGSLSNRPVPATATFANIILGAESNSTAVYTNFDHVRFGPTGTVPVELQSFEVD